MKYIDADFLRKEIDKWVEAMADAVGDYSDGVRFALEHFTFVLDSLQQEQPAKRGYKDCNGCEYNRTLKDQIGWQFRGCFGGDYKGKPIAEIELCPLKVANQQEQQEVDLEKEIEEYWIATEWSKKITLGKFKVIARYFYGLGQLNSK